jgi:O-methyltransferase
MSLSYLSLPKPSIIAAVLERRRLRAGFRGIYRKYRASTVIHEAMYVENLELCAKFSSTPGCVVECGVWRGGMSAGMAEVLGASRQYILFDSFEGMPTVRKDLDGAWATAWQSDTKGPSYHNNNTAAEEEAAASMKLSGATSFSLVKGWFEETVPRFQPPCEIAILRLDGDLYDSTRVCLENLYPHVTPGGLIIVDDYYGGWDGCARAVNEFLAGIALPTAVPRLCQFHDRVAYFIKGDTHVRSRQSWNHHIDAGGQRDGAER